MKKIIFLPLFIVFLGFLALGFSNSPAGIYFFAYFGCWSERCVLNMNHVYFGKWREIVFWPAAGEMDFPSGFWAKHDEAFRGCVVEDFLNNYNEVDKTVYFGCEPEDVFYGPRLIQFNLGHKSIEESGALKVERGYPYLCLIKINSDRFFDKLIPNYRISKMIECASGSK